MLIHGSWHGAWCWDQVAALLRERGHTVVIPELPGHGGDTTPAAGLTLRAYTDSIGAVLAARGEPVVLVGHSFGGAVASQTAELHPEAVRSLVSVCGFLLRDGQSVWRHGFASPRGAGANASVLSPGNLLVSERDGLVDVDRSVIEYGFYPDCSPGTRRRALDRWRPEPLGPLRTPLALTDDRFGRIPRAYVRCLEDRVVPLASQERMCRITVCDRVVDMQSGHLPLLSAPAELAGHLCRLAEDDWSTRG